MTVIVLVMVAVEVVVLSAETIATKGSSMAAVMVEKRMISKDLF